MNDPVDLRKRKRAAEPRMTAIDAAFAVVAESKKLALLNFEIESAHKFGAIDARVFVHKSFAFCVFVGAKNKFVGSFFAQIQFAVFYADGIAAEPHYALYI